MAAAPRPKSPPAPPDPCGRHRLQLAVDALHREIGFLEGEINSIEGIHAASRCCREVDEFIGRTPDPFITISSEKRSHDHSHHFLKKFRKCVLPQLPLLDLLLQQRRRRLLILLLLLLQPQEAELLLQLQLQLLLLLLLLMWGGVNEESVSLPPPQLLLPSLLLRRRRRPRVRELQLLPAVRVLRAAVRGMLVPLHLPVPVPRRLLLRVPGVQVLLRRPSLLPPLLVIDRSIERSCTDWLIN
uniref:G protein gamma domain-containing protein n=1 Tax=Oryza rufipogon TaxID=4529 RepID=A0A0E0NWD3_ORYRU